MNASLFLTPHFSIVELKASNISNGCWSNSFGEGPIFKHRKVISATKFDLHFHELNRSSFQQQNVTFQPVNDKISTDNNHGEIEKVEELRDYEVDDEIRPTFVREDAEEPLCFNNNGVIHATETLLTGMIYFFIQILRYK